MIKFFKQIFSSPPTKISTRDSSVRRWLSYYGELHGDRDFESTLLKARGCDDKSSFLAKIHRQWVYDSVREIYADDPSCFEANTNSKTIDPLLLLGVFPPFKSDLRHSLKGCWNLKEDCFNSVLFGYNFGDAASDVRKQWMNSRIKDHLLFQYGVTGSEVRNLSRLWDNLGCGEMLTGEQLSDIDYAKMTMNGVHIDSIKGKEKYWLISLCNFVACERLSEIVMNPRDLL